MYKNVLRNAFTSPLAIKLIKKSCQKSELCLAKCKFVISHSSFGQTEMAYEVRTKLTKKFHLKPNVGRSKLCSVQCKFVICC